MSNTFSTKPFNELLTPPKGWQAEELLSLSYSISVEALNELVKLSGIFDTHRRKTPEHVWLFCNKKGWTTQKINPGYLYAKLILIERKHVFAVDADHTFHPKLVAILYKRTQDDETAHQRPEHWLRLIVSSRNLTTEKNLEAGVVLDTDDFFAAENKVLKQLLQTAFKNNADLADCELVKYILHADFSAWARAHNFDGIEFLTPQNGLAKTLDTMKNSADDFVAVSPFLHNPAYLEKHLPANKPWLLITTSEVLDTVYDATTKGGIRFGGQMSCYTFDKDPPPKLHAKMFATRTADRSDLLIGSANFSQNGLERNYELDLHIWCKRADYDFYYLLTTPIIKAVAPTTKDTEPPAGQDIPAVFADPDSITDSIAEERDNDILRSFFAAVFTVPDALDAVRSRMPYAVDYALDAKADASLPACIVPEDEAARKELYKLWADNLSKAPTLPGRLRRYRDELEKLLTALNG